ncbi:hypothetical protein VPH35_101894 [Triticum aestivum]
MEAFTAATCRLLSPSAERECAIKTLVLDFFPVSDGLSTLGRAVEDLVTHGETERLEFHICSPYENNTAPQRGKLRQRFMSFSAACPVAFRWLTKLTLDNLGKVCCKSWPCKNPPVRFGYVPKLHDITLHAIAKAWQAPFALSECLPRSARNLSNRCLGFGTRMIWVQLEHPKHLTATFRNLTSVALINIFPECDLSWTLFILEVAPALQNFDLSRDRPSCFNIPKESAEKTTMVWEPSKDLKHLNLKLLQIFGFEEEDKVTNYIRLVMERAVGLKRIKLRGELPCKKCDAIDPRRSQVDEARRIRIKERLTRGSSSSVEIIMC